MKTKNNFGFSLIELLVIMAILIVLFGISINALPIFKKSTELSDSAEKVLNTLKLAQSKTLASEGASQYGVYFDVTGSPNQYVLFKGESYILRDVSVDLISQLPKSIEIYGITLSGSEVVFNRLTGEANQTGSVSLRIKSDPSKTKTVSIKSSGQITLGEESAPSDNDRVKDSRHLHFNYSRAISTTESLTLTFSYDGLTVTKVINIVDNIQDGQIYWEGEVNVNGQNQRIKIHTHQLNSPDTIFCIHRDRRFNDKALTVTMSGDVTGSLVEYSSDGLTTNSTSIFVNNRLWQ